VTRGSQLEEQPVQHGQLAAQAQRGRQRARRQRVLGAERVQAAEERMVADVAQLH